MLRRFLLAGWLGMALLPSPAFAQVDPVILQYFETPWKEIQARMPEIVKVGYSAIWTPPITKGAEGIKDVGFAVFDRFDLGDKDQRGSVRTKYGTKDELLAMIQLAHRFLIGVFPDTVMNHNSNPSRIEFGGALDPVPLDQFPGIAPADFHLLPCRPSGEGVRCRNPIEMGDGTFQMNPNSAENEEPEIPCVPTPANVTLPNVDGQTATLMCRTPRVRDFTPFGFENQHFALLGLVDFAIDQKINNGAPASDDNINATLRIPRPVFIRQPDCPECYPNNTPVAEDIRQYMMRWIRWLSQETEADGFRLDAIKHVQTTFYGNDFAGDPIAFDRVIQDDYDLRKGFSDNNDDDLVDDSLIFGESFSGLENLNELAAYRATGMLPLNFPLFFALRGVFSNGAGGNNDIGALSFPHGGDVGAFLEFGGLGRKDGVSFSQSHDELPPDGQPNGALAFILTRPGPAVVFFDGNNPDTTNFVKEGRVDSLGDLGSNVVTDLVFIHNHFARGGMFNRFVDNDVYLYERVVPGSGATLLMGISDNIGIEGRTDGEGNNKFGEFDPRPLVVTAFPPGTQLIDYTGNSVTPVVTVLDPNSVPQAARDNAINAYNSATAGAPLPPNFGLVFLSVPSGPDRGYVAYSVQNPKGPQDPNALPITIFDAGTTFEAERIDLQTVGTRRTPEGRLIPPVVLNIPRVDPGSTINVKARTDGLGATAFVRIDEGGVELGGLPVVVGSPEKLFDGFVQMDEAPDFSNGDHGFTLEGIDLSGLEEGIHAITVRVAITRPAPLPPIFTTFVEPFLIAPPDDSNLPNETPADVDGDGTLNAQDNCSEAFNPNQEDFDVDGVGDVCDLCPITKEGATVDADGCRVFAPGELDLVNAIVDAIKQGITEPDLDLSGDGVLDILDVQLAIVEVNQ